MDQWPTLDALGQRMMTHEAEPPNPAQPILDAARRYGGTTLGFLTGGLQGAGAPMPDWMRSNPVQAAVQNPDYAAAMGMANPTPVIAGNLARIGRINDMLERGHSQATIADAEGISKAALQRWLKETGQKTAATENPSFWESNPGSVDVLKAELARGSSQDAIARKLGTTSGNVYSKIDVLRNAGEELPGYTPRVSFWQSPDRQGRLEQLVREGWSLAEMARDPQLGAGNSGTVSKLIRGMQERHGKLLDRTPQYSGATTAGRTPGRPEFKSMAGPSPEFDQDMAATLARYLKFGT